MPQTKAIEPRATDSTFSLNVRALLWHHIFPEIESRYLFAQLDPIARSLGVEPIDVADEYERWQAEQDEREDRVNTILAVEGVGYVRCLGEGVRA